MATAWACRNTATISMNDHDTFGGGGGETPGSAAHYIAALTEELSQLAKRNGLDTLGYLLDMARLEADQIAND
jgi:hypothetical protein